MPIASTRPNSVSVLIVKPSASSTPNVPTIETGTASSGMIDARHVCRTAIALAGAMLVGRAQSAGELDPAADPRDVIMGAHAAAWVGEQMKDPDASTRLITTLLAGLRVDPRSAPHAVRQSPGMSRTRAQAASKKRSAAGKRRRHDASS